MNAPFLEYAPLAPASPVGEVQPQMRFSIHHEVAPRIFLNERCTATFVNFFIARRKISHGSFGCVYEAYDQQGGCVVALKVCKSLATQESDSLALNLTRHPNILKVYKVFTDQNRSCQTMELMALDIQQAYTTPKWREEHLNATTARTFAYSLLSAVSSVHRDGVCHLDIKSENILLPESHILSEAKLTDFGAAQQFVPTTSDPNEQFTKALLGVTPAFRPPELGYNATQYTGSFAHWKAIDSYQCGVLLYLIFGFKAMWRRDNQEHRKFSYEWGFVSSPRQLFPNNDAACELLDGLLKYNPEERLDVENALNHNFFD